VAVDGDFVHWRFLPAEKITRSGQVCEHPGAGKVLVMPNDPIGSA
jgi:hypothetical protein